MLQKTNSTKDQHLHKTNSTKDRLYKRPTLQKTNSTKDQLYKRPTPTKDQQLQKGRFFKSKVVLGSKLFRYIANTDFGQTVGQNFKIQPVDKVIQDVIVIQLLFECSIIMKSYKQKSLIIIQNYLQF